jgi:DNA polymerase III delta prime subunit
VALIYYQALGVQEPDSLLKSAYFGLGDIHKVLSTTEKYLKSPDTVMRLGWEPLERKSNRGAWIRLVDAPDLPDTEDSVYRQFLDDECGELFQWDGKGAPRFEDRDRIRVLDREADEEALLLDSVPTKPQLVLRPNTYALFRQQEALKSLQDSPAPEHLPLLNLLEGTSKARWGTFTPGRVGQWWLLKAADVGAAAISRPRAWWGPEPRELLRPGTEEQRRFVEIALATPDFAFLEGPPGSGKTTAICELIRQFVARRKRVLLCGSTHVAVDNVLERLMAEEANNPVIPVRIGDIGKVSDAARKWQLEVFRKSEKERLIKFLQSSANPKGSARATLLQVLKEDDETITRLILDSANLVCGTTLGILQHPDIKVQRKRAITPQFDVMILDEASKTTFAEFLVPALHAKRWVIVGDTKQLSPYVEEDAIAANLESCIGDPAVRNACLDCFRAAREPVLVLSADDDARKAYRAEGEARGLVVADAEEAGSPDLSAAHIVLATPESAAAAAGSMPLDLARYRGAGDELDESLKRRMAARLWSNDHRESIRAEGKEWGKEVAWRLIRGWEQRLRPSAKSKQHDEAVRNLLPKADVHEPGKVEDGVQRVRRVVLPSVLECLQHGFERNRLQHEKRRGNALTDGLPDQVFSARHVLLKYQHRMHPEISAFSRESIYDGKALRDPQGMAERRNWSYPGPRAVWVDVKGTSAGRSPINREEATALIDELVKFQVWAERNPRGDGHPWEVAVITFYRGQEKELRQRLRKLTKQPDRGRHFHLGPKDRPTLTIQLCTVDRFQGQEADVVFLSFAKTHATDFLESPNRLNVALTRARYLRVCFGDRHRLAGSRRRRDSEPSLLAEFAASSVSNLSYGDSQ